MARKKDANAAGDDLEHVATQRGRTGRGSAVQSVRFGVEELSLVRQAARDLGVSTSEYIRDAAVTRASAAFTVGTFKVTLSQQAFSPPSDETDITPPHGFTLHQVPG